MFRALDTNNAAIVVAIKPAIAYDTASLDDYFTDASDISQATSSPIILGQIAQEYLQKALNKDSDTKFGVPSQNKALTLVILKLNFRIIIQPLDEWLID